MTAHFPVQVGTVYLGEWNLDSLKNPEVCYIVVARSILYVPYQSWILIVVKLKLLKYFF
jgi:hypothetical protein